MQREQILVSGYTWGIGRVTKGMDVVLAISNVKTQAKTDKPYDDITMVSVSLRDPFKMWAPNSLEVERSRSGCGPHIYGAMWCKFTRQWIQN